MIISDDNLQELIEKNYNDALDLEAKLRAIFQKSASIVDVINECSKVTSEILLTMTGGMKAIPQEPLGETVLTCAEYELVRRGDLNVKSTSSHFREHFPE